MSKGKVKVKSLSCARLLATPWTAAYQAPLSVGFSRQEYWSGVPLPSPRNCLRLYSSLKRNTEVFLLRETGMSGHFVGRIKGAKYRFDLQYLTWDFS